MISALPSKQNYWNSHAKKIVLKCKLELKVYSSKLNTHWTWSLTNLLETMMNIWKLTNCATDIYVASQRTSWKHWYIAGLCTPTLYGRDDFLSPSSRLREKKEFQARRGQKGTLCTRPSNVQIDTNYDLLLWFLPPCKPCVRAKSWDDIAIVVLSCEASIKEARTTEGPIALLLVASTATSDATSDVAATFSNTVVRDHILIPEVFLHEDRCW